MIKYKQLGHLMKISRRYYSLSIKDYLHHFRGHIASDCTHGLLILIGTWCRNATLDCNLKVVQIELSFFQTSFASIYSNQFSAVCVRARARNYGVRVHRVGVVDSLREVLATSSKAE